MTKLGWLILIKRLIERFIACKKRYGNHFYGSGDLLTAILSAGYFYDLDLLKVCDLALDVIDRVLSSTLSDGRPLKYVFAMSPYWLFIQWF